MTDIEIWKGKNKDIVITITDENRKIIDITGALLFFTVKKKYVQKDADIKIHDVVPSDPVNGIGEINILPEHTRDLKIGNYFYDIQMLLDNKIRVLITGNMYIKDVVMGSIEEEVEENGSE